MRLNRTLRQSVKQGNKFPAVILDIHGQRATARLSNNGQILRNLYVTGGPVVIGDQVYVDFGSYLPIIEAPSREILIPEFPETFEQLPVGSPTESTLAVGSLQAFVNGEISDPCDCDGDSEPPAGTWAQVGNLHLNQPGNLFDAFPLSASVYGPYQTGGAWVISSSDSVWTIGDYFYYLKKGRSGTPHFNNPYDNRLVEIHVPTGTEVVSPAIGYTGTPGEIIYKYYVSIPAERQTHIIKQATNSFLLYEMTFPNAAQLCTSWSRPDNAPTAIFSASIGGSPYTIVIMNNETTNTLNFYKVAPGSTTVTAIGTFAVTGGSSGYNYISLYLTDMVVLGDKWYIPLVVDDDYTKSGMLVADFNAETYSFYIHPSPDPSYGFYPWGFTPHTCSGRIYCNMDMSSNARFDYFDTALNQWVEGITIDYNETNNNLADFVLGYRYEYDGAEQRIYNACSDELVASTSVLRAKAATAVIRVDDTYRKFWFLDDSGNMRALALDGSNGLITVATGLPTPVSNGPIIYDGFGSYFFVVGHPYGLQGNWEFRVVRL
jgi:hypothetical protein